MSVRSLGFNHANHIYTPHRERPWRGNNIEKCRRYMNLVSIHLTLVTLLYKLVAIRFHCQPIVTCSKHLFSHRMSIGMSTKRTFMNFMHQHVCFVSIHASEQDHVIIPFIQNISIDEETASQSPQSFLVFIRCPKWVLLSLEEVLNIEIPRLFICCFLNYKYMSKSIKTPDCNLRLLIMGINLVHGRQYGLCISHLILISRDVVEFNFVEECQ